MTDLRGLVATGLFSVSKIGRQHYFKYGATDRARSRRPEPIDHRSKALPHTRFGDGEHVQLRLQGGTHLFIERPDCVFGNRLVGGDTNWRFNGRGKPPLHSSRRRYVWQRSDREPPGQGEVHGKDLGPEQGVKTETSRQLATIGEDDKRVVGARMGDSDDRNACTNRESGVATAPIESYLIPVLVRSPRVEVAARHHHQIPSGRKRRLCQRGIGA